MSIFVSIVGGMQHYVAVGFFVVARRQGWSIQKRWLAQDIISFSDDQLLLCKLELFTEDAREETEQLCLVLVTSEEAGPFPGDRCTTHAPLIFSPPFSIWLLLYPSTSL